jgi:hypothetical protein
LNRRPADYESAALPTELGWPCFEQLKGNRSKLEVLTKWTSLTSSFKRECTEERLS